MLRDFWPPPATVLSLLQVRIVVPQTSYTKAKRSIWSHSHVEESVSLLYDLTSSERNEDNDIACTKIVHEPNGHPLVITQMAATMTRRALTLQEFTEFYGGKSGN